MYVRPLCSFEAKLLSQSGERWSRACWRRERGLGRVREGEGQGHISSLPTLRPRPMASRGRETGGARVTGFSGDTVTTRLRSSLTRSFEGAGLWCIKAFCLLANSISWLAQKWTRNVSYKYAVATFWCPNVRIYSTVNKRRLYRKIR